jgi:peptidoglycan/xylan/chitin deacetylase (PgdA/CDA1 family)
LEDGNPAADGTASVNDGILKADDRIELDWEADRLITETGIPYFAYPYADMWKHALVRRLVQGAVRRGKPLPFIGYWPDGVSHVAMISHDSDHNRDEYAMTALSLLKEKSVQSTWCMIEPGYSPHLYKLIAKDGHELAFHYNALEMQNGKWDEAEFERQLDWLKKATGMKDVLSNKNHYTRYEGWGELFRWCEEYGIQSDQTRGPSKKGNSGFPFGTCHPYFPAAWWDESNRFYNVLEIGFLSQDLNHRNLPDSSVLIPLLDQVRQVEGVAHFLFHQIHLHNEESIRTAFRRVIDEARARGFVFWTGRQINEWERKRRGLKIAGIDERGTPVLKDGKIVENAVIWVPVAGENVREEAGCYQKKFGVLCKKFVVKRASFSVEMPSGTEG